MSSPIATLVWDVRSAPIRNIPIVNAIATIPFRVDVSFQPLRIKLSAIHPPIGSAIPKVKNASDA